MIEIWIILGVIGFIAGAGQFWQGPITRFLGGMMATVLIVAIIVFSLMTIRAGAPWWYVLINIAVGFLCACIAGAIFGRRS